MPPRQVHAAAERRTAAVAGWSCNKAAALATRPGCHTHGCQTLGGVWRVMLRVLQACLTSQIKDLIGDDEARVEEGKVPQHMVTRYTYGAESLVRPVGCVCGPHPLVWQRHKRAHLPQGLPPPTTCACS